MKGKIGSVWELVEDEIGREGERERDRSRGTTSYVCWLIGRFGRERDSVFHFLSWVTSVVSNTVGG